MAAQQPDRIVVDGKTMELYSNPLEEYWIQERKKRPEFCSQPYRERGYIATWEIQSRKLFLISVEGNFVQRSFLTGKKVTRYTMQTLFPDYDGGRILANWFTGKLRIPAGLMRRYAHHGYETRFEKEILMNVENGDIVKSVMLDFISQTIITQFEAHREMHHH